MWVSPAHEGAEMNNVNAAGSRANRIDREFIFFSYVVGIKSSDSATLEARGGPSGSTQMSNFFNEF
jgi:hypothetical protein